jgi:hypothetical protein
MGGVKDEKIDDGKDTSDNEDAAKEEGDAENPKSEKKYKYYETTNYKGIEIVEEDTMCAFCGEEFAERMLAIQLGNDVMWDDDPDFVIR